MKRLIYIIISFISLCSCREHNFAPDYYTVLHEVERMIDERCFPQKYVLLYVISSNRTGSIYEIKNGNMPFWGGLGTLPTDIQRYGDTFICLMNPYHKSLSMKEIATVTGVNLASVEGLLEEEKFYLLGVTSDGRQFTLIPGELSWKPYYRYPPLWRYVLSGYDTTHVPRFINLGYTLQVDDRFRSVEDLRKCLKGISMGMFYYTSPTDTGFLSGDNHFFATINGEDTLKYAIYNDALQVYWTDVSVGTDFLKKLPATDTWDRLYEIIRDSTFCFEQEGNRYIKTAVPFFENTGAYEVRNDSAAIMELYSKGLQRWKE